jgi:hypothetical protein
MVLFVAEAPVARQVQRSADTTDVAVTIANKSLDKSRDAIVRQLF